MNKTTLLASAVATCFAASIATYALTASAENWTSCTSLLCIDTAPQGKAGLDGSGGWGWDDAANAPVSTLKVGVPANFTVTVLQDASAPLCAGGTASGSITLTYSSQDFSLSTTSGSGATAGNPFDRGGVAVFSYTGNFWCHGDQSDGFTFTPLNETKDGALALVTATINVGGQQASGTYPVAIVRAKKK